VNETAHVHPQYLSRQELAELVGHLERRFARVERWLALLSTASVLILMVLISVAARTGL
jgi:hypothetical protein